jgi:hypothetical protein
MTPNQAQSMGQRMKGAAMLYVPTYEEVEADTTATGQAAGVVAIAAVCAAVGGTLHGGLGLVQGLFSVMLGWLIWAGVTYIVGSYVFGGTATWGELLRTIGFAWSPGVLLVFGFIPILGWLVRIIVGLWILAAGIIAIRQALDFDTGRAVLTAVLGFFCYIAIAVALARGLGLAPQLL